MRNEIIAHFFDIRVINNFNPTLPQFVAVRRDVREIIRNKRYAMAESVKNVKNMKHSQGPRVLLGHRKMMVDDENVFPSRRRLS